jgi:hypothetical protein
MLQNACAQSLENERLWIADAQAYICSHVKIYNNIDRSICCEVTLVFLCLNCEINGGVAAVTVKIPSHTIIVVYIELVHKDTFLDFIGWTSQRSINCIYIGYWIQPHCFFYLLSEIFNYSILWV